MSSPFAPAPLSRQQVDRGPVVTAHQIHTENEKKGLSLVEAFIIFVAVVSWFKFKKKGLPCKQKLETIKRVALP